MPDPPAYRLTHCGVENIICIVYAEEMIVLCYNLCSAAVVKNEIFHAVEQIFRVTKAGCEIFKAGAIFTNDFPDGFFHFPLSSIQKNSYPP